MRRDLGVEAAGNRAGDSLCRVPGPGRWAGGVVAAAAGLVAAVLAGLAGLVTRHVLAAVAGGLIVVLGKAVAFVHALFGLQWRHRPLTEAEKALLTNVYRGSVDLRAVRIVSGFAGVFSTSARPFTLGGTIYLKRVTDPATLVHECAHVWQYQHLGSRYTFEALVAQFTVKPDAYRWPDELARGRTRWGEFNREAQAQLLEDLARAGERVGEFFDDEPDYEPEGTVVRFVHDGIDHTELARAAVAEVRGLG